MHNKDIIFDLDNNRVGLVDSNCGGLSIVKNVTYVQDDTNNVEEDKECETRVAPYKVALYVLVFIVICIVIILVVGIWKLKRTKRFLWIRVEDDRKCYFI
jgi:hypothetical protein